MILQSSDVVVTTLATTISGTDLHIPKGDILEVKAGRILGHEGIGVIIEIGSGVTRLAAGDRVIRSHFCSCGRCSNCRRAPLVHCPDPVGLAGVGWVFGYMVDETRAEFVRAPLAQNPLYLIPKSMTDAEGILLSDILPTGFEIGVQCGQVKMGDVVAVIASGPLGLSAVVTAVLYSPSRVIASDFVATDTVNSRSEDWKKQVLALTDEAGSTWLSKRWIFLLPSPCDLDCSPGRERRQCRGARQVGRTGAQRTVDQEHHDLLGSGEHQHPRHADHARR